MSDNGGGVYMSNKRVTSASRRAFPIEHAAGVEQQFTSKSYDCNITWEPPLINLSSSHKIAYSVDVLLIFKLKICFSLFEV